MVKTVTEYKTDLGGNTTVKYSDGSTNKFNITDAVTVQTNPVTGGSAFQGATSTLKLPAGDTDVSNGLEVYAASTGSSLVGYMPAGTGAVATTVQTKLRESVSVKDFGAVGDGVTDDTAAIRAAEAACAVGQALEWPSGTYTFSEALTITRQKPQWLALGKVTLLYVGASTTIDLITFGDGITEIINPVVDGNFYLRSTTTMTAGTGLRLRRIARGLIRLIPQGQDDFQTYGNKLWNGIWFDETDNIAYYGQEVSAQNDGIRVSGAVGAGPKADLYLNYTKIMECTVGLRVGGAFGGLYTNHITLINNETNVVFDQTLAAENNREILFVGGAIDVTTSGPGIYFNDAGGLLVQFTGVWIASSATHGVHVETYAGKVIFTGCRIFKCGGDGIRVDAVAPYIMFSGGQIHDNGGWGINPNIAGHKMSWQGVQVLANTAGNIKLTYPSGADAELGYVSSPNIKATRLAFDLNCYHQLYGGNPLANQDANDYNLYDRVNNRFEWYINSGRTLTLSSNGSASFGPVGAESLVVSAAGGATSRWGMHGGPGYAFMQVNANTANADGFIISKGTGALSFATQGGTANIQFKVLDNPTANRFLTIRGSDGGNPSIAASGGNVGFESIPVIPAYTVATLPLAGNSIRGLIYVTDGVGNKHLAVSDGANWRWPDGAIVS